MAPPTVKTAPQAVKTDSQAVMATTFWPASVCLARHSPEDLRFGLRLPQAPQELDRQRAAHCAIYGHAKPVAQRWCGPRRCEYDLLPLLPLLPPFFSKVV
jgi:hypothetical protein